LALQGVNAGPDLPQMRESREVSRDLVCWCWSGLALAHYNLLDKNKPQLCVVETEQRASSKEKHRAMKFNARIPLLVALSVLLVTATGCNFLKSRDQLNKGIAAFKNAQYEQATSYFQNAVQLDPKNPNAKLY